jgi:hypothetical protein
MILQFIVLGVFDSSVYILILIKVFTYLSMYEPQDSL